MVGGQKNSKSKIVTRKSKIKKDRPCGTAFSN